MRWIEAFVSNICLILVIFLKIHKKETFNFLLYSLFLQRKHQNIIGIFRLNCDVLQYIKSLVFLSMHIQKVDTWLYCQCVVFVYRLFLFARKKLTAWYTLILFQCEITICEIFSHWKNWIATLSYKFSLSVRWYQNVRNTKIQFLFVDVNDVKVTYISIW